MLALDREAFICDMAETYRIYDIRSISLSMLAVLASGLGINSRIRLKQQKLNASWDIVLLAKVVDLLVGDEKAVITPIFLAKDDKRKQSDFKAFDNIEEFEQAKAQIIANSPIMEEVSYGGN